MDLPCVDVGHGRGVSVRFVGGTRWAMPPVRLGRVVVHLVVGQDGTQVCLAEDQYAVEELAAQGAGQAFTDRVHPGSLDRGAQDPRAGGLEDGVE